MILTEASTHLPELDVAELRVGMDVSVGHTDELPAVGALLLRAVQGLQDRNKSHIVLQMHRALVALAKGILFAGCIHSIAACCRAK